MPLPGDPLLGLASCAPTFEFIWLFSVLFLMRRAFGFKYRPSPLFCSGSHNLGSGNTKLLFTEISLEFQAVVGQLRDNDHLVQQQRTKMNHNYEKTHTEFPR
jgi:hypothetical protein